jgi:D-3-phosphoglycerate dehydrogenase
MSDRPIVLMMTTMGESGMGPLREGAEVRMAPSVDPAVLRPLIQNADGLILRTAGRVDAALLDAAPRLKVVGRHGVGFDHIDIDAATERGIQVVSTPGANTESVVEHTLAMMIGLSKHFNQQTRALAEGRYHERTKFAGRNIRGRSLGIVGFGRIGKRVGEVCHQAFGMSVKYCDIVDMPEEAERRAGAVRAEFDEVLAASEYVTLHVPLDASTRRMIDARALGHMRPDAILINTCRGPVVDERAVADALEAGRLYGYGADVYEVEPPPADHPLVGRTDNVLLTPHSAAQTGESLANMARWVAEDVLRVLRGEPPVYPVNDPAVVARVRARLNGR